MDLVIASHNVHKVREYRSLLKAFSELEIYSLNDFPSYKLPPETGSSFEENASIKALDAAQALNKWVIADDSGLVVPALGGAPGIYSARYAGLHATDQENRKKLVEALTPLSPEKRAGYFECCIALASKEGMKKLVRGICEGELLVEERGGNGFGYDPLFRKYDYNQTFAQMDESLKNRISHRRKAFDKLVLAIEFLVMESCTT